MLRGMADCTQFPCVQDEFASENGMSNPQGVPPEAAWIVATLQ